MPGGPAWTLQWRHRARVAEAMVLLAVARLLVACVPFNRWSRWFGAASRPSGQPGESVGAAAALRSRRIGRAVERAAERLPIAAKCLPQAMAAQIMARRRAIPAMLVVGVLPATARGTGDDLHAWVICGEDTIVGAGEPDHSPLLVLR